MKDKYILTLDQSTSGTKAVLFNTRAELVLRKTKGHRQFYPKPGWVEHDPEEIYQNCVSVLKEIIKESGISREEIAVLSITNQRETVLVWDRNTGKSIGNAIVWQCRRGKDICQNLREMGYEAMIKEKTGLVIDPYFSASGINWILNNNASARKLASSGELLFGTIDTWLVWKLTDGRVHTTDYTNACRTMLFNLDKGNWDKDIMQLLEIPMSMAPSVRYSDEIFGYTTIESLFKEPLPIAGILGDSHAAFLAQLCFERGLAKATYGTGSSVMMNIGRIPLASPPGLVTSIGYGLKNQIAYVFEGNIHCTGCAVKWLIDDLGILSDPQEAESLATSITDNDGVYLVPAFAGLGAPYWNNEAKAVILGMTRGTNRAHIARAALEAIAYQIKDLLDLMCRDSDIILRDLRVDGGPTRNEFLMQFQSDMLDSTLSRSEIEEASALGSAMAGGLATGIWKDLEELKRIRKFDTTFRPHMDSNVMDRLYSGWRKAVARAIQT